MTTVAVLGTGTMGAGMTRSILRAGMDVRVWNRTAEKAAPLADDGAVVAATPAEAVDGADVVVVMLFDADAVLEVLGEVAGSLGDAVVLQSSTVGVDGAARIAAAAKEHGIRLLDAPVLGTKAPAEQGALVMLVAGDPALLPAVRPVLAACGSKTVEVSERLGDASALKLACNSWVASITAAAGQALAIARALGVDPALVLSSLEGGASDSPYLQLKGKTMLSGDFAPQFALDGVRKDLGLMRSAAASSGVDTGLLGALLEVYGIASQAGHGGDDMAAVATAF